MSAAQQLHRRLRGELVARDPFRAGSGWRAATGRAARHARYAHKHMEQAFNQGDLAAVDRHLTPDAVDYQEPVGTDFVNHLKQVISALRTAFPDLHFEIHDILSEGDLVAFRSTMTGTHLGPFTLGLVRDFPPTGRKITVAHMHFVRIVNGRGRELWHLWDITGLMRQLGLTPGPQRQ